MREQDAGIVNDVNTPGHGEALNLTPYSVSESARVPLTRYAAFSQGRHLHTRERAQHRTGWLSPLDTQAPILEGQAQNWPEAAGSSAQLTDTAGTAACLPSEESCTTTGAHIDFGQPTASASRKAIDLEVSPFRLM